MSKPTKAERAATKTLEEARARGSVVLSYALTFFETVRIVGTHVVHAIRELAEVGVFPDVADFGKRAQGQREDEHGS